MFIRTQNEIISLMPTARWDRVDQLYGYLEEEERVALEPLLGTELYLFLLEECERLRKEYVDITANCIKPTGKARSDPGKPYADITEQLDSIQAGELLVPSGLVPDEYDTDISRQDMQTICLLRICQQIEFYRMLSHKTGMLTVSFNEGGGMNAVSAEGYDSAEEKAKDRVVKDAFMSAGRSVDSLLLFLEADAKTDKFFTERWKKANAYYLHKDLLFQTACVLNEYLDIKNERMAYVQLVRDIRFCQNTYVKPRIGLRLLRAVVEYANEGFAEDDSSDSSAGDERKAAGTELYDELLSLLRTALGFYVESRRTTLGPKDERLARRDSMTDAQQAMAAAEEFIEENLEGFGEAAEDSPIYKRVQAREAEEQSRRKHREEARERGMRKACKQDRKKLFTAFPATHIRPETK